LRATKLSARLAAARRGLSSVCHATSDPPVVAADRSGRQVLITQRPSHGNAALLWEFPGGRVEEGSQTRRRSPRELKEEMEIEVDVGDRVIHVQHSYPPLTTSNFASTGAS